MAKRARNKGPNLIGNPYDVSAVGRQAGYVSVARAEAAERRLLRLEMRVVALERVVAALRDACRRGAAQKP